MITISYTVDDEDREDYGYAVVYYAVHVKDQPLYRTTMSVMRIF